MNSALHAVSWNLTERCNLRCGHCYLDSSARNDAHPSELDKNESISVVRQLSKVNNKLFLIITGGEPLLHPHLHEIVECASSAGMTVVLGTNGTLLTERSALRLKDSGLRGAGISLDSANPAPHDRFRGVNGAWNQAIEAVEVMKKTGLEPLIQFSIFSWNLHELSSMAELAVSLGVEILNLYFLVCTGRGEDLTDLTSGEYETVLEEIHELQERMRGTLLVGVKCAPHYKRIVHQHDPESPYLPSYQGGCPAATHYCRIDNTGGVTPCPYMPASGDDLRKTPFQEIWESSPRFTTLRNRKNLGGRCGMCEYISICGGCRARALADGGKPMDEDPSCDYKPDPDAAVVGIPEEKTFGLETEFSLKWTGEAADRLSAIPSFLKGMVISRVEAAAVEAGLDTVTPALMKRVRSTAFGTEKQFPLPNGNVPPSSPKNVEDIGKAAEKTGGGIAVGIPGDESTAPGKEKQKSATWSSEALKRIEDAPSFVRPGIKKLMAIRAGERGHSVITSSFLTEIRNESMMRAARIIRRFGFEELNEEAFSEAKQRMQKNINKVEVIRQIELFLGDRTKKNIEIIEKFRKYLEVAGEKGIPWTPEALEWLDRQAENSDSIEKIKRNIEPFARRLNAPVISMELLKELEIAGE